MLPIAAVQTTAIDIADVNTGVANGTSASGFMALFAQMLSGQGAKADPAATLLSATEGVAKLPTKGTEPQSESDPAALSLVQSLVLPALVPTLTETANPTAKTQTAVSDAVGLDLNQGKKLPSKLATLADQLQALQADVKDKALQADASSAFKETLAAKTTALNGEMAKVDFSTLKNDRLPTADSLSSGSQPIQIPMAASTHAAAAAPADKPAMTMQASFGATGWQQELGDKVVWMASGKGHVSDLILNPPSLGTVEIRLHVNGTEAGAQFFAANADVRNALEQALPRLREMMAEAGIALGNAMVSSQSFSQQDSPAQNQSSSSASASTGTDGGVDAVDSVAGTTGRIVASNALLDYYA